eukprot:CAMPEP_0179161202 /NCGR_PEP_ID=MMETSP0796-20121207/78889_1 /TAXON_ID=73915 /ORGANISM="Pyrodinium bahamense, Strain pbaha01" /LENGTH=160 /DNA_ID=CAMNT_0020863267 /DNA_START=403 /DNA_END=883 /DNA_ORIENTATION=-
MSLVRNCEMSLQLAAILRGENLPILCKDMLLHCCARCSDFPKQYIERIRARPDDEPLALESVHGLNTLTRNLNKQGLGVSFDVEEPYRTDLLVHKRGDSSCRALLTVSRGKIFLKIKLLHVVLIWNIGVCAIISIDIHINVHVAISQLLVTGRIAGSIRK